MGNLNLKTHWWRRTAASARSALARCLPKEYVAGTAMPPRALECMELEDRVLFSAAPLVLPVAPHVTSAGPSHIHSLGPHATPPAGHDHVAHSAGHDVLHSHAKSNVVLIDSKLTDSAKLIADVAPGSKVFVYNSQTDTAADVLQRVVTWADKTGSTIENLAILSHGVGGAFELGNQWITTTSLPQTAAAWNDLSKVLAKGANLEIYGCNVASLGSDGQGLLNSLASITHAAVYASTDVTGAGGNWKLEAASAGANPATLPASSVPLNTSLLANYQGVLSTIAIDTTTSAATTSGGASSLTFSHTVNSGSNSVLVVEVGIRSGASNQQVSSITYGGQSLTFVGLSQRSNNEDVEIWSLVAPSIGTANVVVNLSGSAPFVAGATDYFGVDQTTPFGTAVSATGNNATPSVSVSSTAGQLVIDALVTQGDSHPVTPTGSAQSQVWNQTTGNGGGDALGGGSYAPGASTVTMSWSEQSAHNWAIVAVPLMPAAVASTNTITVTTTADTLNGNPTILSILTNLLFGTPVSLRDAITAADNNAGSAPVTIDFNISGGGTHTINLLSALPAITSPVILDATSQPGYSGTPVVVLNGASAGSGVDGLTLDTGSSGSTIRGLAIDNFSGRGLLLTGGTAYDVIAGNYLGTNATGTAALGNGSWNIDLNGAGANNLIGGLTAADRNVIVSSSEGGIAINGATVTGTVIEGNYIGVGADGTTALGNGTYGGILFWGGTTGNVVGGTTTASANIIANNATGINIQTNSEAVAIEYNSIYGNTGLGIDLNGDGVTSNTAGGSASGPNDLENFPVLAHAITNGAGQVWVDGAINSNPNETYRLEFFSNPTADPSGHGQGQTYLGYVNVTTDSSGNASFGLTLSATMAAGTQISATATNRVSNVTSEFALDIVATAANHAPTGTNNTVATPKNASYVFTAADFGFSDPNDTPANSLLAVKISTLPGAGSLSDNGVAVTAGQFVTVADINLGRLLFTPTANATGTPYASFIFQVQDNGGTVIGGVDLDPSPKTMTVNVLPPGSAPVAVNDLAYQLLENQSLTVAATGVLANDTSFNGHALTEELLTLPSHGSLGVTLVGLSNFSNLTNSAATDHAPSWSPDSTKLIFSSNASGTYQIYEINADGTNLTRLTNDSANDDAPAWSPDGTKIAFYSDRSGTGQVYMMNADGSNVTQLTNIAGTAALPSWSPDGTKIAFRAGISGSNQIFVMNADGSGVTQLTSSAGANTDPAWSPDGTKIAFTSTRDGNSQIYLMNVDGSNQTRLSNNAYNDSNPTWGPGSAILGFMSDRSGTANLYLMYSNGTNQVRFTASTIAEGTPAWSPNALRFALASGNDIVVANVLFDGSFTYTPTTNYAGSDSFTYVAYDGQQTSNVATVGITVNAVTQPPQGTSHTVTTLENTPYTFSAADFGFSDPLNSPANNLAAVEMTTLPSAGVLTDNGVAVTAGQLVSAADIVAGKLIFTPATYATGASYSTFTFQVESDGSTANGGVNLDPTARTMTVNVTAVTQAPQGTNKTITTFENSPYTFTSADFGFVDPHNSPANSLAAVEMTTLPSAGTLTDNGIAVTAGQLVSVSDINSGLLLFTPATYGVGTGYTSFTFQVESNGSTANGGVVLDPSAKTMTVNVTPVTQPPSGTSNTVTTLENVSYTFTASDFGFVDPHNSPANGLFKVKITTLPGVGSLTDNGVAVIAGQVVTVTDINAGLLLFTPVTYGNGAAYASFTFQVKSNGGTANGGVNIDPSPKTMTVDVTAVTQAPQGTSTTVTTLENADYTFTAADFGFNDPHNSPANSLINVKMTTVPTIGSLTDDGIAVTAGQLVSIADINAGKLTFTPVTYANGTNYASFTFQVESNGSTTNGGVVFDPSPKTMTIDVTWVNQAPLGTSNTVSTLENVAYTFSTADFGFSDPHDSPANSLLAVKVTALPTAGSLTDNGIAVTVGQLVSAVDINAGKLLFTPAIYASGANYTSFAFNVKDDGGTLNGGIDVDPSSKTMTVNVKHVNQSPQGTGNSITALIGTPFVFTAADFGFSDPHDNPPNSLQAVKITTLPTAGSLTDRGVAVIAGQLVGVSDINAGKLIYTSAAGASGSSSATFTFQVQDNGGTIAGAVDIDPFPKTMILNVTAVAPPAAPQPPEAPDSHNDTPNSNSNNPAASPTTAPVAIPNQGGNAPSAPPATIVHTAQPTRGSPTTATTARPSGGIEISTTQAVSQSLATFDRSAAKSTIHGNIVKLDANLKAATGAELGYTSADSALGHDLDSLAKQFHSEVHLQQLIVGTAATVSASLTVGYVIWMIRGGLLLSSLIAQMPAWWLVDPLIVLSGANDELFNDQDKNEESLASIIEQGECKPEPNSELQATT